MRKITIVGPGRVGESAAQAIAKEELCKELVLIGIEDNLTRGVALDIQESAPVFGFDTRVVGGADPALMAGSDLVIICAGVPRKPGMSRDDLLESNIAVINEIVDNVLTHAPDAMLLLVTNPVDVLTYQAWRRTSWDRRRVLGLSGVLDSTRMASFVALETGFSVKDINAMVLGGHGDAMVPLPRFTTINGIPLEHFLDKEAIERIVDRSRKGGAEVLALKQTSSAYDSPAAAIATMADAMAHDRRRILPCVAVLDKEYGEQGIAMGVPVVLSARGVEKVIELPLSDSEREAMSSSAAEVRVTINKL